MASTDNNVFSTYGTRSILRRNTRTQRSSELDIIYRTTGNCITLGELIEAGFTPSDDEPDERFNAYKGCRGIQLYYDCLTEHPVYGTKVMGLELYFGTYMGTTYSYGEEPKSTKLTYSYHAYFKDIEVFKKFLKEIDLDSYVGKPDKFVPPEILEKYNNNEWGAAIYLQ